MMTPEECYDILGLQSGASKEEVKAAYRHYAKEYHPDTNHDPNAAALFRLIKEAYETLNDPETCQRSQESTQNAPHAEPVRPEPGPFHSHAADEPWRDLGMTEEEYYFARFCQAHEKSAQAAAEREARRKATPWWKKLLRMLGRILLAVLCGLVWLIKFPFLLLSACGYLLAALAGGATVLFLIYELVSNGGLKSYDGPMLLFFAGVAVGILLASFASHKLSYGLMAAYEKLHYYAFRPLY